MNKHQTKKSKTSSGMRSYSSAVNLVNRFVHSDKDKPFKEYSQIDVKSTIDKLYTRKVAIEADKKGKTIHDKDKSDIDKLHKKDKIAVDLKEKEKNEVERAKMQRYMVNKELRELEKTKPFYSELELKEVIMWLNRTNYL